MFASLILLSGACLAQGSWSILGDAKVVCIHTALLPNMRVMCAERPHQEPYQPNALTNGYVSVEINLKGNFTSTIKPIIANPFCSGHAQTADGKILLVGGENGTFTDTISKQTIITDGKKSIRLFDPCKEGDLTCSSSQWNLMPSMKLERWYPTVTTLGNGKQIIISGSTGSFNIANLTAATRQELDNPTYEYYPSKTDGVWPRNLSILQNVFPYNLYPVTFQLPSGKVLVFCSNNTALIDPISDAVDDTSIKPILIEDKQPWIYPYSPTAVMLPLTIANNYAATVQICGGSRKSTNVSDTRCIALDFAESNPQWKQVDAMPIGRIMPDAVLLPDATILYTNGGDQGQAGGDAGKMDSIVGKFLDNTGSWQKPVFENHIFDPKKPAGSRYTRVASSTVPRLYHSGAILLQDGRVATMGSEMQNYVDVLNSRTACMPFVQVACTSPFENRIEAFEPPYLSLPQTRPVIDKAPSSITYQSSFIVTLSTSALEIDFVSFIRYSTTTHSTNTDQRLVELAILGRDGNKIYLEAPRDGNLAPPGNWMLFLLNKGKPSESATILLGSGDVARVDIPSTAAKNKGPSSGASILSPFVGVALVLLGIMLV